MLYINTKTSTLGFARSLLALGTLLTIIFNPIEILFPPYAFLDSQAKASGVETLNLFFLFNYKHIWIPYILSILILVITISGYIPRLTSILHAWVTYSLYYSMLIVEGGDQISSILSLLLIPICLTDNRKNHWKSSIEINQGNQNKYLYHFISTVYIFIRFQMAILYLDAGVEKFKVPEWVNGTATYYWFNHNVFGAPIWLKKIFGNWFANIYFVTSVTWLVLVLELTLFTGLFIKQKFKYILFVFGIFFHFLIFITHGLPTFGIAMTAGLTLYLFNIELSVSKNFSALRNLLLFKNETRN